MEYAKSTYPKARERWMRGLPNGQRFFVTTWFRHTPDHVEQVFVLVEDISEATVRGRIASDPMGPGYESGDHYEFSEDDLVDWTIQYENGAEEGNFVGKFLDRYRGECPF
jgi:hypothetical protein